MSTGFPWSDLRYLKIVLYYCPSFFLRCSFGGWISIFSLDISIIAPAMFNFIPQWSDASFPGRSSQERRHTIMPRPPKRSFTRYNLDCHPIATSTSCPQEATTSGQFWKNAGPGDPTPDRRWVRFFIECRMTEFYPSYQLVSYLVSMTTSSDSKSLYPSMFRPRRLPFVGFNV